MDKSTLVHLDSVRIMNARGMSQRAIAEALGISKGSVSRLLKYKPETRGGKLAELQAKMDAREAGLTQAAFNPDGWAGFPKHPDDRENPDDTVW
jgi:transcriptional regulator with XRE-family HTH domain